MTINTRALQVLAGSQVSNRTSSSGDAGKLTVNASDSVQLIGESADNNVPSGLFARTEGAGAAGALTINTRALQVLDGAVVSAGASSTGSGGTSVVNPKELVELRGTSADGQFPSLLTARTSGIGDAGDVTIETGKLIVRDGAGVIVSSEGTGDAGNLRVQARSIRLDNQSFLSSDTKAGQGNIFLDSQDLVLRRGSNITTDATGTATGGNITIDTGVIAALEDSDISANAEDAKGGRVIIDAQGIIGTEFREKENPATSDITATSRFGPKFSGTVEINTPDVDLSRGLVNLPAELMDASNQIAQSCPTALRQGESKFVITGRGGLPPNPSDPLNSDAVWIDLDSTAQFAENRPSSKEATQLSNSTPQPLVEATGWALDDRGQVVLTASRPTATPHSPALTTANCQVP